MNIEEAIKTSIEYETKVRDLYRKAADMEHASAQNMLGNLYFAGQGVKKDLGEAEAWWRKAAEQEYAPAQYNLGGMYSRSLSGSLEREEAEGAGAEGAAVYLRFPAARRHPGGIQSGNGFIVHAHYLSTMVYLDAAMCISQHNTTPQGIVRRIQ